MSAERNAIAAPLGSGRAGGRGPRPGLILIGAARQEAARQELALAREIRARELVIGRSAAGVAAAIVAECTPAYGTTGPASPESWPR
jgi:hypothetical protein